MSRKPLLLKLLRWARDVRTLDFLKAVKRYSKGNVLDVGGGDFYLTAKKIGAQFTQWTTLEFNEEMLYTLNAGNDENFKAVIGDGCDMRELFDDEIFDTLINAQVLEHVMEPNQMVRENARVLKTGGVGIFLVPQTSVIHMAPTHYYNFTKFWIESIMSKSGLKIIELKPLGGFWSSRASHLIFFFFKICRVRQFSYQSASRNIFFWLLLPLMLVYILLAFPLSLIFSLGDLSEEPNNHLVVVQKT